MKARDAVVLMDEYIACLPEPRPNWSKEMFDRRCYELDTVCDLSRYLANADCDAVTAIRMYISQMDDYYEGCEHEKTRKIFEAMRDAASEILLLFL